MKTSKLSRCVKAPIRVLCRARDFYVKSMNNYAGRMPSSSLPKSFSVTSARTSEDEELRTMIRVLSQRSQRENLAAALRQTTPSTGSSSHLPKSFSVGMGKIDEDQPCDFAEDFKPNSAAALYPRSRSYAVVSRKTGLQSSQRAAILQ